MPQIPQPWDVQGILANQQTYALLRPQVLTIYMQDFRTEGEPDHLLAELNIPLWKDANEQWWVNADDMVRKLQSLPGRIDGLAKLSIKRGIYRQPFCRVSATSIEKCHPETLRVTGPNDHSIEIVIEPLNHPPPPPPLITTSSTATSSSTKRHQSEEEDLASPAPSSRTKRRKPDESPETASSPPAIISPASATGFGGGSGSGGSSGFPSSGNGFLSPAGPYTLVQSPQSALPPSPIPSPSTYRPSMIEASSPVSPSPVSEIKAADARRNAKNELAKSVVVPWLRAKFEREEGYPEFAKSKGRILTIHEALKGYRFAKAMIQKYNNAQTPPDLDGAPNRKITKVNIWQALDRQTSWGSDAETTLALVDKYGPGAPDENQKIVDMLNGKWGPDEREGSVLFLNHLKRIDAEHKSAREAAAAAAMAVVSAAGMA
ncbi:hypothetical protein FS837_004924 [Tulasnella sp. UAMH 9824]|nr:hypothetical protein FS837_004924 [Tulasnella sp. UAMH 9824]